MRSIIRGTGFLTLDADDVFADHLKRQLGARQQTRQRGIDGQRAPALASRILTDPSGMISCTPAWLENWMSAVDSFCGLISKSTVREILCLSLRRNRDC